MKFVYIYHTKSGDVRKTREEVVSFMRRFKEENENRDEDELVEDYMALYGAYEVPCS